MKRSALALALLTSCLAVSACGTERIESASALRPDKTNPERFVCDPAGTRPTVPAEYQIDWAAVGQAPSVAVAAEVAKAEVAKLVASIRTREGIVAGYILKIEGRLFICHNNMIWQRDFYAGLPADPE